MIGLSEVQHGRQHMPHLFGASRRIHVARTAAEMALECAAMTQAEVSDWLRAMIAKHRVSPRAWAQNAGLGKDTVSRALKPGYEHVTSTRTLAKLAAALNEPTPGLRNVPPAKVLLPVVERIGELHRRTTGDMSEVNEILASALRDILLALADDPEAAADPRLALTLVRRELRRSLPSA